MKIKKIVLYLLLFLLFGVAFYFLFFGNENSFNTNKNLGRIKNTNAITKICLIEKQDTLILEKNTDQWLLNANYLADSKQVKKLLEMLSNIKLKPLSLSIKKEVIKELEAAVNVAIYKRGKLLQSFFLKKRANGKIYLMSKEKKEPYEWDLLALEENPYTYFSTHTNVWQSKKIVQFLVEEITSFSFKNNSEHSKSFLLEKAGELFFFKKNEKRQKIDEQVVRQFLMKFTKLTFQKYAFDISKKQQDSIKKTTPIFEIKIENVQHEKYQMKAFYKPILKRVDEFGDTIKTDPHQFLLVLENNSFVYVKYYDFEFLNFPFF